MPEHTYISQYSRSITNKTITLRQDSNADSPTCPSHSCRTICSTNHNIPLSLGDYFFIETISPFHEHHFVISEQVIIAAS